MKFKRTYHQDSYGYSYITVETPNEKIQFQLVPRLADVIYIRGLTLLRDQILYPVIVYRNDSDPTDVFNSNSGYLFANNLNNLEKEFNYKDGKVVLLEDVAKINIRL